MSNPNDLASFRAALLEGDRRLVRRRRTRAAGGAVAVLATALLIFTVLPNSLDTQALAAEARKALALPGILHSKIEIVLPDGQVQQRIERWSMGARSRTISVDEAGRRVEQATDGTDIQVRLEPGGPVTTIPGPPGPDPLLEYRAVLDRATAVEEVTLDGVEAYRFEVPGAIRQVAYARRSDRLPLRVELEGGVTHRFSVERLPADPALLSLTAG
jgi:hypothetical protein